MGYSNNRYGRAHRTVKDRKPGYKSITIDIRDPREAQHDFQDYEFWDDADTYYEPLGDFLARIVQICAQLEDPVIRWGGEESDTYMNIEALRPPTEAERAAAEKKRLAAEKKEKAKARELLAKHPDLIKEFTE